MSIINLLIGDYDINVSPDKREIYFKNTEVVIKTLKNCMELFIDQERSTSKMVIFKIKSYH